MSIFAYIPSKIYDLIVSYILFTNCDKTIIDFMSSLQAENILDIGAGTGRLINMVKKQFPQKHIEGIEFENKLVREDARANIKIGNFLDMSIQSNYDLVLCLDVLHHIKKSSQDQFISKISHSITKGGFFIIQEMNEKNLWASWIMFWERFLGEKIYVCSDEEIVSLCKFCELDFVKKIKKRSQCIYLFKKSNEKGKF